MKKINWQLASINEIAIHISNSPDTNYRQQLYYYRKTNNTVMLAKVEEAKRLADAKVQEINTCVLRLETGGVPPADPHRYDFCE